MLGVLACNFFGIAPARASGGGANILVVTGTDAAAITAGNRLNTDLGGSNTVVVVNTGVPGSLVGYTQIFDTRYDNHPAFSVGEQAQYLAFLNASPGNTIFLMGENASFNVRNTPISAFIALAGGGTVPVPSRTVNGPETVNPPLTGPNVLLGGVNAITYAACGLVTSAGTGVFASQETGGGCAIYFGTGTLANATQGALVVVYDVNFIYDAQTRAIGTNEIPFRLNLEQFVSAPTTPPTVTSINPVSGSGSGGTPVTITGAGFTGATGVTIGGTAATGVVVVNDTSITATTPAGPGGPASVTVITPSGVSAANALYSYLGPVGLPTFQMSLQGPIVLQVVQNESLLISGTFGVLANQGGTFQATTTTPWLTLTQTYGTLNGALLDITANAAGLTAGSYEGTITVTADGQTLSVPVTFTVLPPASITVSPTALPSSFGYQVGSATGYDVQVGPAGVPFTVQTSADSSTWLTISPTSGIGLATVHVVIDPSKATYGTYQDSIVITSPGAPNSPLSIPVRMTVSNPTFTLPLENGATGAGASGTMAPNEIVSLFLTDLSCSSQPVVSLNGVAVAWSEFTPGQLNYAVPANVTQPAALSVACDGSIVWNFYGLHVAATMPGIFTSSANGSGQADVVNGDGTLNGGTNPASRGSYVSIYVTGFGVFDAESADGLRRLAGTVTAQIGGVDAIVEYAGESPGNTDGLQQINLLVPANAPVGAAVPLMLWVNGTPTQTTTTIAVE